MGDSKTADNGAIATRPGYFGTLTNGVSFRETLPRLATAGHAVADRYATIDANLAAYTEVPDIILLNFGVNDGAALEADWKDQYGYILDQMHARWPNAQCYVAKYWTQGGEVRANTMAGWVDAIVATRAGWCFVGIDERTFLPGSDDGATYTVDGTHPNAAGYALTAQKWREAIGL